MPNNTLPNFTSIIEVLLSNKIVTEEIATKVKNLELQTGKSQEEIILENNYANDTDIVNAKSKLFNVPFVDLATSPSNPEAQSILQREISERFIVFPIGVDMQNKILNLAMLNPLDLGAIEFIEQKTGYKIKPYIATKEDIMEAIATKYTSSFSQEVTEALKEVGSTENIYNANQLQKTNFIRNEKIAEMVTKILDFAVRSRASDVHIEPLEGLTRVRYRIDGILQEKITVPKALHEALVSRIKIISGLKIDEKRIPQDGRFAFNESNEEVDLRVSTLPTSWGEKVVMRLLKKTGGVPSLPELGLRGRALKNFEDAILRPHGIILICGPTGSGKSTTLYSVISKINSPKVNIVSIEDPVEYKIPGVNQVQINPAAGLTFASGLRAFLRQDPNIIYVGEIRDKETADLAIQASLTGHLVFSTLHTNDASGALPRLLDMGAEPYLLASSITAIVAQRVVRKIHEECKESYDAEPKVVEEMKTFLGDLWPSTKKDNKVFRGKGDDTCGSSGYYGRIGIFEVLPVSEKISRIILSRGASSEIEKQAREEGMISMKQDGYLKVLEGITSIEEILRVAQE